MEYKLIRSDRKSISIRVCDDGSLLVRAPKKTPIAYIDQFINNHTKWINEKQKLLAEKKQNHPQKSAAEIAEQIQKSYEILLPKIESYSLLMGIQAGTVRITKAEKRFGSCSSQKHLCFSYRLIEYPDAAIDYVVVHELAHLKELNHSKRFWDIVSTYLPDYKSRQNLLKQ